MLLRKLFFKHKPKPEPEPVLVPVPEPDNPDSFGINQEEAVAWAKSHSVPMHSLIDLDHGNMVQEDELELEKDLTRNSVGSTTSTVTWISSTGGRTVVASMPLPSPKL